MLRISEKDIFVPVVNRDLRKSYPELAKIPEFKGMRSLDIKFCWYYAVYFSDEKSHASRVKLAVDHSYRSEMDPALLEQFIKNNFPDSIRSAIKRFESFDIGSRIRAKFVAERMLDGFEKLARTEVDTVGVVKIYALSDTAEEGDPVGEKRDWNQVNAYVNSMVKINEALPDLVKRVEEGFGVSAPGTSESMGANIRDDFQRINEEQQTLKKH